MPLPLATSLPLLSFWSPGLPEMLIVGVIALLLYGGDLPKVARSWGKSFSEFRRGLSGIQDELSDAIYNEPQKLEYHPDPYAEGEPDAYAEDHQPDDSETAEVPLSGTTEVPPTDEGRCRRPPSRFRQTDGPPGRERNLPPHFQSPIISSIITAKEAL